MAARHRSTGYGWLVGKLVQERRGVGDEWAGANGDTLKLREAYGIGVPHFHGKYQGTMLLSRLVDIELTMTWGCPLTCNSVNSYHYFRERPLLTIIIHCCSY